MKEHSALFEKYKARYEKHYCTRDQLDRLARVGALTEAEVVEIAGEEEE